MMREGPSESVFRYWFPFDEQRNEAENRGRDQKTDKKYCSRGRIYI